MTSIAPNGRQCSSYLSQTDDVHANLHETHMGSEIVTQYGPMWTPQYEPIWTKLINCLIDLLIDCSIDCLIVWPICWSIVWSILWSIVWSLCWSFFDREGTFRERSENRSLYINIFWLPIARLCRPVCYNIILYTIL